MSAPSPTLEANSLPLAAGAGPFWVRLAWLGALAALAVLVVFDARARIDPLAHDRYALDVRELVAIDARLDSEVMRSRQLLVAHYDPLVRTTAAIEELHARLQIVPAFLTGSQRAEVLELVGRSRTEARSKRDIIEAFKSQNAVLRNSERFFPTAAEELRDGLALDAADEASHAVNELLTAVLRYLDRPGSRFEYARTQAAIDALIGLPVAPAREPAVDVVSRHAQTILERGHLVAVVTEAILASGAGRASLELDVAYGKSFQWAIRNAERRRVALFVLALGALAGFGAEVILRLRRSSVLVRDANQRLAVANAALEQENERERDLRDLKSRFVSMASHELRTPLAVILSSAELLEAYSERWSPAKKADHFHRIKRSIEGVTELLDRILMIGRADAGRLVASPAPLDVARWARGVVESMRLTLTEKHTLEADIAETGDLWVDEKLLAHILTNLLSNGVKYSPEGGVVRLVLATKGDTLELCVSDHGIGIPREDRGALFENFHRGANVGTIRGTGLGLAIVQKAAEAHGGSVEVDSEVGHGTTFTVVVSCASHAQPEDSAGQGLGAPRSTTRGQSAPP